MARDFSTGAVVLGSHKLGDADRVVTLFTSDKGKVPTVVKGVRKVKSRFGGRLEPFTLLDVRLHEGRNLHTLTSADTIRTGAAIRERPHTLKAGLSFVELLTRTTTDNEPRPRTWNLVCNFLRQMEKAAGAGQAGDGALLVTLGAELKLLLLSGYLPHLTSCSACGSRDSALSRFSASAGGALCLECPGESFPIPAETLASMRSLLERPLEDASGLEAGNSQLREVWHCVREICRYHLGIDLKVRPWL